MDGAEILSQAARPGLAVNSRRVGLEMVCWSVAKKCRTPITFTVCNKFYLAPIKYRQGLGCFFLEVLLIYLGAVFP